MVLELPWGLYSMEMDADGERIGAFFKSQGHDIMRVNPLQGTQDTIEEHNKSGVARDRVESLVARVIPSNERVLALMSHGGQHHFTYGLCKLADKICGEYGYIQVDNHRDDGSQYYWIDQGIYTRHSLNGGADPDHSIVECGYFVDQIAQFTNVANIGCHKAKRIILGDESSFGGLTFDHKFIAYMMAKDGDRKLRLKNSLNSLEQDLRGLPNKVYVTIDLDVLKPDEVRTAFSRGVMSLDELMYIIGAICEQKTIVGASIIGYTESDTPGSAYNGCWGRVSPIPTFEKSMLVYSTLVKAITGNNGGSHGSA